MRRLLIAGVTTGVFLGSVSAVAFAITNRYLTAGYPQLALMACRGIVDRYTLGTVLVFSGIGLAVSLASRRLGVSVSGAYVSWLAERYVERLAGWLGQALGVLGNAKVAAASLLLLAGVNAAAWRLADQGSRPRLNVLLITVDALRADHLGAYGYPRPTSPHIDRLGREGVVFWRAVSQWPKTSPSFASMLSSTYGHTNGLVRTTGQRLPDRLFTVAELLKAARFDTSAAVANVNLGKVFNFHQGFDIYREIWEEGEDDGSGTELVTRRGLELLERGFHRRPFFLWLHYFDPHAPYEPPGALDEMFVGDRYFDPARRAPLHTRKRRDLGGIPVQSRLGREDRIDYYVAQYDAEIRYVDEQIGILLRALEGLGLASNTLVILTADHGESLGEHNYFFEHGRFPYDDCVRVPLILRGPGTGTPGRLVRSPVELIDVLPTVLELAALPPSPDAEGKSLRPLLVGDRETGRRWTAFSESGYAENYQRSITSERYKLISVPDSEDRRVMQGRELELYDLQEDPGEKRNLIDERPDVARPLEKRLRRWMAGSRAGARAPEAVRIDPGTEERLRSLGYLD
ncbi:MAG TPA: sulfatase [Thermoanaerobaculia bacterium]|jgi:arylsulfatase A-like enzyme|nr:sulfatase [Thermoanaerobaculia bacterium]